jgi:malonyl-ACP decarboxylase
MNQSIQKVVVTGCGVMSSVGMGIQQFTLSLKNGHSNYSTVSFKNGDEKCVYPAAQINSFRFKESVECLPLDTQLVKETKHLRNISLSTSYGIYCALEAWADAGLSACNTNMQRVAIISSGTNTQQAMLTQVREQYSDKLHFINPNYGLNFFDSDVVGVLSELLGVRGEGYAAGAASASGNMAIIQGYRLIGSGEYDAVIVIAPLMELSKYEYQALTSLGAMARLPQVADVSTISCPFDNAHSGFVYGELSGCIILESAAHSAKRKKTPYGSIAGYGIYLDGNRNPNPSMEGELIAIKAALNKSNLQAHEIDYINTHGTGSAIGDKTEVAALVAAGLQGVKTNSTKSITGHGLSAAGVIECIATLIQMKESFIHPSLNLGNPISAQLDWITKCRQNSKLRSAISNGFAFGGVNTSIVIQNN